MHAQHGRGSGAGGLLSSTVSKPRLVRSAEGELSFPIYPVLGFSAEKTPKEILRVVINYDHFILREKKKLELYLFLLFLTVFHFHFNIKLCTMLFFPSPDNR